MLRTLRASHAFLAAPATLAFAALALLLVSVVPSQAAAAPVAANAPVRVVIVGLVHDHARGLFGPLSKNPNVQLVGVSEPDTALAAEIRLLIPSRSEALLHRHGQDARPDFIPTPSSSTPTSSTTAKSSKPPPRRGISSMVEKPLATNIADAIAIRKAAREHHVQVLVNYETTWYSSNAEAIREVNDGKLGTIRRVVVHDGHEGPKEIGVSPDFLNWLTDPVKNGAGAMFDFGCYGADLMTLIMHGETPLSVTAVALTDKPDIYPKVDDDATIIVRYKGAEAVLQPSWAWSFARKDMEVYGTKGYLVTEASSHARARYVGEKTESEISVPPLADGEQDSLDYLAGVLRGQIHPDGDLSSLKTNMIVMQILDAAHQSAKTAAPSISNRCPNNAKAPSLQSYRHPLVVILSKAKDLLLGDLRATSTPGDPLEPRGQVLVRGV